MVAKLLAIVGPTASGKTTLGLLLAKEKNGEIISVDSRQVYRDLSVGTAKPNGKWSVMQGQRLYVVDGIPHHLVDTVDPNEIFSAARFVQEATAAIEDVRRRDRIPILVGGTGLYFKSLTEGLAPIPPANNALRAEFRQIAAERGRAYLHQKLKVVDPEAASHIPANNIARVIRALEVQELTKKPISQWHREHQLSRRARSSIPLTYVGLDPGREELQQRIEARCRAMLDNGMIEETGDLLNRDYTTRCPALSGLGYPCVVAFLQGKLSKDQLLALLIRNTRQYAKRQLTWFRHQAEVEWKKS